MTEEIATRLSADAARTLTDEVKADAASLWRKLLALYEGEAHSALGYSSWGAYYEAEFGQGKSRAYQLLKAARVDRHLSESTTVERPKSEAVARELTPLVDEPEQVAEAWTEVVELHGPEPTAAQVREVVAGVEAAPPRVKCPTCGHMVKPDDIGVWTE